jgi:putative hemolysin
MSTVVINIVLIMVLVVIQGVFVAAELALVSLRESQIRQLAHRGSRGQLVASLTASPNLFLSVAQVGVTVSGFLAAAFGADRLSENLTRVLARIGLSPGVADLVAVVLITIVISYVSIVLGELTAKRLALQRAEAFALALAPLVNFVARAARPVIWLLGVSTNVLVRLVGGDPGAARQEVSDEVPRTEVDFLPGDMPVHRAVRELSKAPHSRYPVTGESADDIIGFVHVRDLFDPEVSSRTVPVHEVARPVLSMPDTVRVLRALNDMRRNASHLAIVVDEYGGTAGIVTMEDLVEELVGDITDEYDVTEERGTAPPGDLVVDGLTTLDEFAEETGMVLPDGPYDTVAGYFMAKLGQLPSVGDVLEAEVSMGAEPNAESARLELRVSELDGRRASAFVVHRLDGENGQASD